MKAAFLLAAFLLNGIIATAQAKTLVISDIDDTVKYIDILSPANTIYNGLFKMTAFAGMASLYQVLDGHDTTIYYVSGSPTIIRKKLNRFMQMHGFPQKENMILKSGSKISTYEYKVSAIKELIKKFNPDSIILIGDDTKNDPQVYETIFKNHPSTVEAIYIRAVRNLHLPKVPNILHYVSAVEIAGYEMIRGKIDNNDFLRVAKAFNYPEKRTRIFIKNRHCPKEGSLQIEELKQRVNDHSAIKALEKTQEMIINKCAAFSIL